MNRLIETYLLHVKSHLPRSLRDDVAAEIEEGLRQKIEAREAQTGREVSDEEIGDMLSEWGHPVQVAGQYLPRQYLIGPATYPVYWHALKALVIVFAAIFVVQLVIHSATGNFRAIAPSLFGTLWGLVAWAGIMTIAFAVLDDKHVRFFSRFDARRLPARQQNAPQASGQPITRFESAFSLIFIALLLTWWLNAFGLSLLPSGLGEGRIPILGYEVGVGANAERFFYPVVLVLLAGVALWGRCFLRPYWTRPFTLARLLLTLAQIALLGALLRTPDVLTLTVTDDVVNADRLNTLLPIVVWSVRFVVLIVILANAIGVITGAIRLLRNRG